MLRLLILAAVIVAIYWALLFLIQRSIAFPAPPPAGAPPRPADAQSIWLESEAGRTEAWFLPPLGPSNGPAGLVLFAHGNAELIDDWPDGFAEPRSWGLAVLLVEYPGYGRSGGRSSRRTIEACFEAAFDWAVARPDIDARRVILYGRSLGGGAVGALSLKRPAAALVFESTFTNTTAFASGFGAPAFLVRDRFDNLHVIAAFQGPRLIVHGSRDEVVPIAHGRRLAAAAGIPLHELPCGHNDCPRPWPIVKAFLETANLIAKGSSTP
jgi:pimeloyl-ACP methyl ester carboxylesterase